MLARCRRRSSRGFRRVPILSERLRAARASATTYGSGATLLALAFFNSIDQPGALARAGAGHRAAQAARLGAPLLPGRAGPAASPRCATSGSPTCSRSVSTGDAQDWFKAHGGAVDQRARRHRPGRARRSTSSSGGSSSEQRADRLERRRRRVRRSRRHRVVGRWRPAPCRAGVAAPSSSGSSSGGGGGGGGGSSSGGGGGGGW